MICSSMKIQLTTLSLINRWWILREHCDCGSVPASTSFLSPPLISEFILRLHCGSTCLFQICRSSSIRIIVDSYKKNIIFTYNYFIYRDIYILFHVKNKHFNSFCAVILNAPNTNLYITQLNEPENYKKRNKIIVIRESYL